MLSYRHNASGTLQAAYSSAVRIGYIEQGSGHSRWLWSLNTIQPKGGRASGIVATEAAAKEALADAWATWLTAAGLKRNE